MRTESPPTLGAARGAALGLTIEPQRKTEPQRIKSGDGRRARGLVRLPKFHDTWGRINPNTSNFLPIWDTFVAIILIYTAIITPYEISFMEQPPFELSSFTNPIFIINRLIELIFILDMGLQFVVMVPRKPPTIHVKPIKGKLRSFMSTTGNMVRSRRASRNAETPPAETPPAHAPQGGQYQTQLITSFRGIACNYLKTWFLIDMLSVVSGFLPFVEMLRTVRCLRLLKLVRLAKSSRTFERLKSYIALDYSMQTVIRCLITYLVSAHWFACILVMAASYAPTPMHSFMGAKGYCVTPEDDKKSNGDGLPAGHMWVLQPVKADFESLWTVHGGVYCTAGTELWLSMFYWMIMIISGASGGDTNREDMLPGEQAVMAVIVVFAALLWTTVIANFVDVLTTMNPEATRFSQRMDSLNRYCRHHHLDGETRTRLREYMYNSRSAKIADDDSELIRLMSPKLQGELALQVNGRWLGSIVFLQGIEPDCLFQIGLALRTTVFVPAEYVPPDSLYYLNSGSCSIDGTLAVSGSCWGEGCILQRSELRGEGGKAVTYAEVSFVHREALMSIIYSNKAVPGAMVKRAYPIAARKLRWAAVLVAIKGLARKASEEDSQEGPGAWSFLGGRGGSRGSVAPPAGGSAGQNSPFVRPVEPSRVQPESAAPHAKAAEWVKDQDTLGPNSPNSDAALPLETLHSRIRSGESIRRKHSSSRRKHRSSSDVRDVAPDACERQPSSTRSRSSRYVLERQASATLENSDGSRTSALYSLESHRSATHGPSTTTDNDGWA